MLNSFTDPGTAQPNNYDNAVTTVQTLSPLIEQYQTQVNAAQSVITTENQNIASYQIQLDNSELTEAERFTLEQKIQISYENISAAQAVVDNTQPLLESTTASYTDAATVIANTNLTTTNSPGAVPTQQVVDQSNSSLSPADSPNSNLMWHAVVGDLGVLRDGVSLIKLQQEDGTEVVGTVAYDPTDDRFLLFSVDPDTVPANTLSPVNAVINPLASGPGAGLPAASQGQRYLLTEDTGSDNGYAQAWAGPFGQYLVAQANDIIEYDGSRWIVVFDSTNSSVNKQYVTNITTDLQYEWTGDTWIKSYQGLYPGGTWSLVL